VGQVLIDKIEYPFGPLVIIDHKTGEGPQERDEGEGWDYRVLGVMDDGHNSYQEGGDE
jgi:hypothetical protein